MTGARLVGPALLEGRRREPRVPCCDVRIEAVELMVADPTVKFAARTWIDAFEPQPGKKE
jgi:hypothetical protein